MRLIKAILATLLLTLLGWADTTITGQVLDPNNNPYRSGTYQITFIQSNAEGAAIPTVGGSTVFQQFFTGILDTNGNFPAGIAVADNNQVTPSGSQWKFSICASGGTPCFSTSLTITGASQSVTASLQAAAALLNPVSLSQTVADLTIDGILKLADLNGADDKHWLYGNAACPTLPTEGSLGNLDHVLIQCKVNGTPNSWVTFIHSQTDGGGVPENEWVLKAYYHPAVIVDNIGDGSPQGRRATFGWRDNGNMRWMWQFDPTGADTNDIALVEVDPGESRFYLFNVPTWTNTIGVGTTVQNELRGNTRLRGSVQSEAFYNNTTGRAAFSWLKTSGEQTWLRHSGVRQLTLATARDSGTEFITLGGDSGVGNGGEFYLWGVGGVGATDYERLFIGNTAGGEFNILTQQGGTGVSRTLNLGAVGAAGQVAFKVNNTTQWIVNTNGDLITASDGLNDIGLSGNNRPANIYASTEVNAPVIKATTAFTSGSDPADAGTHRLANAEQVCWEAAPAGGDICIDTDASEVLNLGGVNASAVSVSAELTIGAGGMAANAAGFKHSRTTEGCATAASAGATCDVTITWGTTFADANYTVICSGLTIAQGVPVEGGIHTQIAASVQFRTVAATAAAAEFDKISCIAVHD
jgi:hypothetical protein